MEREVSKLRKLVENGNTLESIEYVKNLLEQYSVLEVYELVVNEVMKEIGNADENGNYDIVKEHIISALMRTVIENCFEHVERAARRKNGIKVLVTCLQEEYHDLGARMMSDVFKVMGFETYYLGSNTPNEEIVKAAKYLQVDYIALSITNFLNLRNLRELLKQIKKYDFKVILGGQATRGNDEFLEKLDYDYLITAFKDLEVLL